MMRRSASALFLSLGFVPVVAGAGELTPQVEHLANGSELIVAEIPDARSVSMRYIVHAGEGTDPSEPPGIAHLLEHVIFHGSYSADQETLFQTARAHGAAINGLTFPHATHYTVDVPEPDADRVLSMIVEAVTAPAILSDHIDLERNVIRAETELRPSMTSYRILTLMLLPSFRGRGLDQSGLRAILDRDRLVSFYNRYYRPSNTTIVLTGDISMDRAKKLLESTIRIAPADGPAPNRPAPPSLSTPVHGSVPAPVYVVLYGYDLSGADRSTCRGLANLIDLRLNKKLVIERPISSHLSTECIRMGGNQLLVTIADSQTYAGGDLRGQIEAIFRDAGSESLSAKERALIERSTRIELARRLANPASLADALAAEIAPDPPGRDRHVAIRAVTQPLALDAKAMKRSAAHFFEESRRVVIDARPF